MDNLHLASTGNIAGDDLQASIVQHLEAFYRMRMEGAHGAKSPLRLPHGQAAEGPWPAANTLCAWATAQGMQAVC